MELLEKLARTPGVPGREHQIRDLILKAGKGLFDETYVDAMGSLVCRRKPRPGGKGKRGGKSGGKTGDKSGGNSGGAKVLLAAHMDQIGFLVRHVDDKGFVRLQPVGGFDTRNLFARLVSITTTDGELVGVMNPGGKPVHIASDEDRKKVPDINEFVVDLGLPADKVKKRVKVGDMAVLKADFHRIGDTVVSQCLDNRIACWAALRAIEATPKHDCEIWAAFTVQEEVGCRGAGPVAAQVEPDVSITLDTTLCCDTPGVPEDMRITQQGQGVGLMVMDSSAINNIELLEQFEAIAAKKKIKAQRTILPRGGTDTSSIQRNGRGYKVMTLVCGLRYIHTVTEMAHVDDMYSYRDLLAAYLEQA